MQANMLDAKNRLSELVKAAQAGEEVLIADRGVPVARLLPVSGVRVGDGARGAQGIVAWLDAHPLPERLCRSPEAIASGMADKRVAWD